MTDHQFFGEDSAVRRTIADALDVLAEKADFSPGRKATVSVKPYELPWGEKVGQITTRYVDRNGARHSVPLPYAANFSALDENRREMFHVFCLDGAIVDFEGYARLKDGRVLRGIEVCRLDFPLVPTGRHYKVIHTLIAMNDAQNRCYFPLRDILPADVPDEGFHDIRFIDCNALSRLKRPQRKKIARKYRDLYEEDISTHTIGEAMRLFGLGRSRRLEHNQK